MAKPVYWMGKVPVRDDFGKIIVGSFIDGETTLGPWGIMTLESFEEYGVGLGPGLGQKFQRQDDDRWLKVEG